jgi:hypothetical protein
MNSRVVNTISSMFNPNRKEKDMTEESVDKSEGVKENAPAIVSPLEINNLSILGSGTETPELHVRYNGDVKIVPLANPVTGHQIADILNMLG